MAYGTTPLVEYRLYGLVQYKPEIFQTKSNSNYHKHYSSCCTSDLVASEGVSDDEFIIEKGWTHLNDKEEFFRNVVLIPFLVYFMSIFIFYFNHITGIGYALVTIPFALWMFIEDFTNWRPATINFGPKGIIFKRGRREIEIPFDASCQVNVGMRYEKVDRGYNPIVVSQDDMGDLGGIEINEYIEGIQYVRNKDNLYFDYSKGWTRKDIQRLWRGTCLTLSRNEDLVIREDLQRFLKHLMKISSGRDG